MLQPATQTPVHFMWLEITGKCNLSCIHCYADSGPTKSHGTMTVDQWEQVITDANEMGITMIQFIGGEPTTHPHLPRLIRFAYEKHVQIEVFSNLVHISPPLWTIFQDCQVSLATSFYDRNATTHDQITTKPGSQQRTLANIRKSLQLQIPLRVGMIQMHDEQYMTETGKMLQEMGVPVVSSDHMRTVGRGARQREHEQTVDALCGHCDQGTIAVDAEGWVYPCVFSRWLPVGNVTQDGLARIVQHHLPPMQAQLAAQFAQRTSGNTPCEPTCPPRCSPTCQPTKCEPRKCWPKYQ